MTLTYTVW